MLKRQRYNKMISIIGAGPAGNHLAYLLSDRGFEVQVFEEHSVIGKPVQCTGILSEEIRKIIRIEKDFVTNKIRTARIFSSNNSSVEIRLKENIIINRERFDDALAEKAMDSGANFYLNSKFEGLSMNEKGYSMRIKSRKNNKTSTKIFRTDCLVGADGPLSSVAKHAGIFGKRRFFTGLQIVCKYRNDNVVNFLLMKKGIGWIVPENEYVARIGVAVEQDAKQNLNEFLQKIFGNDYKKIVSKKIEMNAGLIPIFNPMLRIQKDNIFLLGDAATQVKASTLGGIIPGLKAAELLTESLSRKKNYAWQCIKNLYPDLVASLISRRIIDKCSNKEMNLLMKILKEDKIKKILLNNNRDEMSALAIKAVMNEPRLLYFLIKGL